MTAETVEQLKRLVEALTEKVQVMETCMADTVSRLQTFETQVVNTLRNRVDTLETGTTDTRSKLSTFETQVNARITGLETKTGGGRKERNPRAKSRE